MERERDSVSNADLESNHIGSELLINPKRATPKGAASSASSVKSEHQYHRKRPLHDVDDAGRAKPSSASERPSVRSPTLGNVMGSRHEAWRPPFPARRIAGAQGEEDRRGGEEEEGDPDDAQSEAIMSEDVDHHRRSHNLGSSVAARRRAPPVGSVYDSERVRKPPHGSKYSARNDDDDAASERSTAESSTLTGSRRSHHYHQRRRERTMTDEEVRLAKQDILHEFDRLEAKGHRVLRRFTVDSSLEEMKAEFDRIKRDKSVDNSVQFQRNVLMMCVNSIEYLNNRFDPFDIELDGWSMNISDSLGDYDEIFEKLHEKYGGTSQMAPELQLLFGVGGSAMMFHLENKLYKKAMGQDKPKAGRGGGGGGGLFGMLGNLFKMGPGAKNDSYKSSQSAPPPKRQQQQQQQSPQNAGGGVAADDEDVTMRGPMNDDILREIQQNMHRQDNNERIEMVSTAGDSDMDELKNDAGVSVLDGDKHEDAGAAAPNYVSNNDGHATAAGGPPNADPQPSSGGPTAATHTSAAGGRGGNATGGTGGRGRGRGGRGGGRGKTLVM